MVVIVRESPQNPLDSGLETILICPHGWLNELWFMATTKNSCWGDPFLVLLGFLFSEFFDRNR